MKAYTGVGSRETPEEIQEIMHKVGEKLADLGWVLRTGAAKGADQAFELGWVRHVAKAREFTGAEIYLPWDGYENHARDMMFGCNILPDLDDSLLYKQAEAIAEKIHPNWAACKQGARKMHSRNIYQVLGRDLKTPSKMLICWMGTKDPNKAKGGTASAWNLAKEHGIPCFNLNVPEHFDRISTFLEGA